METLIEDPIVQKTRELCQAILDQPDFQKIRQRIDTFLADEPSKTLYQLVSEKGEYLQHKQERGAPATSTEIADFERDREALINNPVASDFLNAQEEMHKLQEAVQQYVTKTFELGRVPAPDEMNSGSCGHGCGCHH